MPSGAVRLCSSRLIVTATTTTWTITSASSIWPRSSTIRPSTTVPMPRGPNQPMKARLYIGRSLRIKAISTATIRTAKTPSTANSTTRQPAYCQPSLTANAPNIANTTSSSS